MTNEAWVSLTDAEKGQLVSIWILAADKDGHIPDNPIVIQRMAMLDTKPNLKKFIDLDFLTVTCQPLDNHLTTINDILDAPETETETEKRQRRDRVEGATVAKATSTTGHRLPEDWQPSPDELAWCMKQRPDLDPEVTAEKFRDYWISVPGQKGRKVNWTATWRSWVRNEKALNNRRTIEQQNAETLRRLIGNA